MNDQQAPIFVPLDYEMDPQFEDLLMGDQLENGMIVLIEGTLIKADPTKEHVHANPYDRKRLRENNRWCTVTNLNIQERYEYDEIGRAIGKMEPLIRFIGVYADGTKAVRTFSAAYGWIVKLGSIPDRKELE